MFSNFPRRARALGPGVTDYNQQIVPTTVVKPLLASRRRVADYSLKTDLR
jgi:hypothetical protein